VTPPPAVLERIRRENARLGDARRRDIPQAWFLSGFAWPVTGASAASTAASAFSTASRASRITAWISPRSSERRYAPRPMAL